MLSLALFNSFYKIIELLLRNKIILDFVIKVNVISFHIILL